MSDKTKIGDRMKSNYESRTKQLLPRRTNTIIRLDGKAFHTWTKGLDRPFDEGLIEDMQETTKYLCENVQGCKLGYTQSDEITLLLTDYDKLNTEAFFDGNVQKITSVTASMATARFNELRQRRRYDESRGAETPYSDIRLAMFDSRVFTIPEPEEVVNCLLWRQQDAERNSIFMLAQSLYSHKELHKKNTSQMQDMCWEKGHNWNDLHWSKKRGSLVLKTAQEIPVDLDALPETSLEEQFENVFNIGIVPVRNDLKAVRNKWKVVETPIFTQNRDIILNLMKNEMD